MQLLYFPDMMIRLAFVFIIPIYHIEHMTLPIIENDYTVTEKLTLYS